MLRSNTRTISTISLTRRVTLSLVAVLSLLAVPTASTRADEPGRGLTRDFEIAYLKMTINHHFTALRMTELAAGTDRRRDGEILSDEGTSPTPGFAATAAKATLDEIKNIARRSNRTQREEILVAQRFLRQWYGIEYQPQLSPLNRARINVLEQAQPGDQFNELFLKTFSRHHFVIAARSLEAVVSRDLEHQELDRYARSIFEVQINSINDMRTLLSRRYNIHDYQPTRGLRGESTGDRFPDNTPSEFREQTSDEDEDGENHYQAP